MHSAGSRSGQSVHSFIPVAFEAISDETLCTLFRDLASLPEVRNRRIHSGKIFAEATQRAARYMECDPRVERVCMDI